MEGREKCIKIAVLEEKTFNICSTSKNRKIWKLGTVLFFHFMVWKSSHCFEIDANLNFRSIVFPIFLALFLPVAQTY